MLLIPYMKFFSFDAADSKLMDFLKQEIQHEKSAASSVPSSMLFEVTSFFKVFKRSQV